MTCHLADKPHDCFTEHRRLLNGIAHLHSWTHIPCSNCKYARINAEICHVPEADEEDHQAGKHRWAKINPRDFDDVPLVDRTGKSGPIPKTACKYGHLYSEHGYKRKDGGQRCRKCERGRDRNRDQEKYQKKKAKKDKAFMEYVSRITT